MIPENAQIYDCWEKAAKRLINTLLKHANAWIFDGPVKPDELGIPDYFTIVKQPMDLQTVKNKLQDHQYLRLQEFLGEVQLTFDNCILYNGETS